MPDSKDINVWSGLWEAPGTNLHYDRMVAVEQPTASKLEARLSGGPSTSQAQKEGPKPKRGLGGTVVKKLTPEEMLAQAALLNSNIQAQSLDSAGRPSYVSQLYNMREDQYPTQPSQEVPEWLVHYMNQ